MTTITELSDAQIADLLEIQRLHDEAFDHYLKFGDGFHKSSEGHVSVSFGNYFDRASDHGKYEPGVEIYSYVFGPNRNHYFDTIRDGLAAVKKWHADEMAYDYQAEREAWDDDATVESVDFGKDVTW